MRSAHASHAPRTRRNQWRSLRLRAPSTTASTSSTRSAGRSVAVSETAGTVASQPTRATYQRRERPVVAAVLEKVGQRHGGAAEAVHEECLEQTLGVVGDVAPDTKPAAQTERASKCAVNTRALQRSARTILHWSARRVQGVWKPDSLGGVGERLVASTGAVHGSRAGGKQQHDDQWPKVLEEEDLWDHTSVGW